MTRPRTTHSTRWRRRPVPGTRSGKPITAEDCAEAAVYLVLRPRAANITGVLLPVDGGYVAR